jgi:hypothetical protein
LLTSTWPALSETVIVCVPGARRISPVSVFAPKSFVVNW